MSTGIEWTDETWNPVVGCDRISPGCAHCYAKTLHDRRHAAHLAGRQVPAQYAQPFEVVQLKPERLKDPLHWRQPRQVLVNSVSDLFHADVPDEFIDRVFAVMALTPQHTYQILTKRAERMRDYVLGLSARLGELWDLTNQPKWVDLPAGRSFPRYPENWPLPNVWLGVSVENQRFADERIPLLLQTPAAIRFISAEPLLGPVSLRWLPAWPGSPRGAALNPEGDTDHLDGLRRLDWVIVGGESGPGARPFDLAWARSIVRQCVAAGVSCFVKQLGAVPVIDEDRWRSGDGLPSGSVRLLSATNHRRCPSGLVPLAQGDRKGGNPEEWPTDLRVREWPRVTS